MPKREDIRSAVQTALQTFASGKLADNTKGLLNALGYDSDKTYDLAPNTYEGFYQDFARKVSSFDPGQAKAEEWTSADVIFQVADEDLNQSQNSMFSARALQEQRFNSLVFMAIGLRGETYTRTDLAKITREVNKCLPMPVIILFRHGSTLTLAVIQRRQNLREGDQDVLAKVTLVKDIDVAKPHTAHVRILAELSLDDLADRKKHRISNFETLFEVWQEVLDTTELNKRFYRELSNWYFWALQHTRFPDLPNESPNRNGVALIRLITRLIFVWFLKEKELVPSALFDRDRLNELLTPEYQLGSGDGYYRAILQNLFFATLNTEMNSSVPESRSFKVPSQTRQNYNREYMTHTLYRYQTYFKDPDAALQLFADIPFLNGGLFECLDRAASESPSGKEERIDGFSDSPRKQAQVPDKLFFGEENVDLNDVYGTKNKRLEHVRGILNIFNGYKFTVDENTPIEEEVALDPELLGKVFENLLASYNPETETTARKQTGSFYTPREIVNYMVDESLIAYFTGKLNQKGMAEEAAQEKLRLLFAYLNVRHTLTDDEVATLIAAIDEVKILDPACGSGAFPMGVLLRLVEILGQLDDDNERWQKQQLERVIAPVLKDKQQAEKISYDKARESAIAELDERLKEIRAAFAENDYNYARKLFLIENCIYGVDIQPIAVQIAKLRFFITLIVDQRVDNTKKNRGIIALPNLETKFVAANTLISLDTQTGFVLPEVVEKEKELEQVRSDHFNARRYADKKALRERDKKLRSEIEGLLTQSGFGKEIAHQLAGWNPYDQSSAANFFDARWMFDTNEGFDVVIGNPPYMRIQGIRDSQPDLARHLKEKYKSATGSFDLYVAFVERGLSLLSKDGLLNYIMPDKWTNAAFGSGLRKIIVSGRHIERLISFGAHQVFNASTYTSLLWLTKSKSKKFSYYALNKDLPNTDSLRDFLYKLEPTAFHQVDFMTLNEAVWTLASGEAGNVIEKLNNQPRRVKDVFHIFVGLQTSKDSVYFLSDCKWSKDYVEGFSPELGKRVELEAGTCRPLLKGDQVHRFSLTGNSAVVFPYRLTHHNGRNKADLIKVSVFQQSYPSTWQYLRECEATLRNRERGAFNDAQWYRFGRDQGVAYGDVPKLLSPDISKGGNFAYDSDGRFYTTTTVYGYIKKTSVAEDYRFWLAVMNSRVLWFYLKSTGTVLANGYFRYKPAYLYDFPLPQLANLEDQVPFIRLSDYVTYLKTKAQQHPQFKTSISYLERVLDGMVYELYLPDELHAADRHIIKHVEAENLPTLEDIKGDKLSTLQAIFERLYANDHPVRENLYFLDSIEAVRIIEGKA